MTSCVYKELSPVCYYNDVMNAAVQ